MCIHPAGKLVVQVLGCWCKQHTYEKRALPIVLREAELVAVLGAGHHTPVCWLLH